LSSGKTRTPASRSSIKPKRNTPSSSRLRLISLKDSRYSRASNHTDKGTPKRYHQLSRDRDRVRASRK
jgi:hypothetical protein